MSQNALERLFNNNNDSHREYTLEEQMASAEETDDFLDSMSTESKDALMNKIQEVTIDEPDDVTYSEPTPEQQPYNMPIQQESMTAAPVTPTPVQQVASVSEPEEKKEKPTRGRPKKHTGAPVEHSSNSIEDTLFVPIMDQLAKDLIDDLIKNDYKISRFTTEQMKIVYDYMYNKF